MAQLFGRHFGFLPCSVAALCGSGSNRRYFRLSGRGCSAIGVIGVDRDENRSFVSLAGNFRNCGLNVPTVYEVSEDFSAYLQEDLGDAMLSDLVAQARKTGDYIALKPLLEETVRALPHFQFTEVGTSLRAFDARHLLFDLNYFKYCFLKPSSLEFDENLLQDDFEKLCRDLLDCDDMGPAFLYRDFQSRNVMVRDGKPWFIDFQGGRRGPVQYDIVSFVYQVRAAYPPELRRELVEAYLSELEGVVGAVDRELFSRRMRLFRLFRMLQVLGAYGFRGLIEHKAQFVTCIPDALAGIQDLLAEGFPEYPYLETLLSSLSASDKFCRGAGDTLEVKVFSFSYKKGVPEDYSGNGGGYVFDCRYIHNPGRYEQYRNLTGLDEPVASFLENDGEILDYLKNVETMVDAHIQTYLRRGFTSLSVAFGCTGGQHRSVYCAQALAEHIAGSFARVRVVLTHRELGIAKVYGYGEERL
ncbi:MAG: phosphotransferase [Candidatus Cryptobacteroides sp.]